MSRMKAEELVEQLQRLSKWPLNEESDQRQDCIYWLLEYIDDPFVSIAFWEAWNAKPGLDKLTGKD